MWNYLKADLEELVSVVKEDSNVVLERVQHEQDERKKSAALREAERLMTAEETFVAPLLSESEEDIDHEEMQRIEQFQKTFDLEQKTNEIASVLEEHTKLRELFEQLVPEHVRYEDFWERFFYRCDEHRIQEDWERDDEQARQARAALVGSVSSFLGGGVKAVVGAATSALADTEDTTVSRMNLEGKRPPFVLNTAVDESDEDEELGWDDDEEEDDEEFDQSSRVDSAATPGSNTEQIVFKDEALETVQEQLKQAMEERDQLQQTVELQKGALAVAKSSQNDSEVNRLRLQLEEQAAEIACLQQQTAKVDASEQRDVAKRALDEVQHLTDQLSTKDLLLASTRDELKKANEENAKKIGALEKENDEMRRKLTEAAASAAKEAETRQAQEKSSAQVTLLTQEVASLKTQLEASLSKQTSLETELASTKYHLKEKDESRSNETPDTVSTGVKLDKPVVTKITDDDDDEDWGDDW